MWVIQWVASSRLMVFVFHQREYKWNQRIEASWADSWAPKLLILLSRLAQTYKSPYFWHFVIVALRVGLQTNVTVSLSSIVRQGTPGTEHPANVDGGPIPRTIEHIKRKRLITKITNFNFRRQLRRWLSQTIRFVARHVRQKSFDSSGCGLSL